METLYLLEHLALAFLLTCAIFAPALLSWQTQRRPTQALIALGFATLFAAFAALGVYTWAQEDWSTIVPKTLDDTLKAIGIYLAVCIGLLFLRARLLRRQPPPSADAVRLIRRDFRLRFVLFTAFLLLALVSPRLAPPDRSLVGGTTLQLGRPTSAAAPPLATPAAPRATLGATPRPGDVLYRADWSGGLGAWTASEEWSVIDGTLVNSGALDPYTWEATQSEPPTLLAPYRPTGVDTYAVAAEARVTPNAVPGVSVLDPSFGFFIASSVRVSALLPPLWRGYKVGLFLPDGGAQRAQVWADGQITTPLAAASFRPGTEWRTYRIEVRGDTLTLLVDGATLCQITIADAHTGDQWIGLWSAHTALTVRDFTIVAL